MRTTFFLLPLPNVRICFFFHSRISPGRSVLVHFVLNRGVYWRHETSLAHIPKPAAVERSVRFDLHAQGRPSKPSLPKAERSAISSGLLGSSRSNKAVGVSLRQAMALAREDTGRTSAFLKVF